MRSTVARFIWKTPKASCYGRAVGKDYTASSVAVDLGRVDEVVLVFKTFPRA